MYRSPILRFTHLFLVVCGVAAISHAAPAPVETTSHIFPLRYVGFYNGSAVIPQIALKANFVAYTNLPSYKQFLDAPENSPERTIAHYVQLLTDKDTNLTPEKLSAAKGFYIKDERKDNDEYITRSIESSHRQFIKIADIRMWHRYDAGQLSIISLAYVSPSRVQPFTTFYLRKSGVSYFITEFQNGPKNYKDGQSVIDGIVLSDVVTLNESNLVARPHLADVPQPIYPYSVPLQNSLPQDAPPADPMEILFTGQTLNILVDENMAPANPVQAIIKRAIQTRRKGTLKEFLSLWTDYDVNGYFARNMALQTGPNEPHIPVSSLGFFARQDQIRIVFTIDYELGSLVFLRRNDDKKLHMVIVWKQAPDDYRLSETGSLERGDILPDNLNPLFDSSQFQSYVNDKVDQFINLSPNK